MSRGLTDPVLPEQDDEGQDLIEMNQAIDELYTSHNMLHDRLVRLERDVDHCACKTCKCKQITQEEANAEVEAADRKFWKRGL